MEWGRGEAGFRRIGSGHFAMGNVVAAAAGVSDFSDGRMNREYASDSDSGPGIAVPFQLGSSGLL